MADLTSFIRPDVLCRTINLKSGQTIVHLGCGAGFYIAAAAKIVGNSGHAIGVDILPDMLVETASRANREGVASIVQTIRGDVESTNGTTLPDVSAHCVLMVNILHLSHPEKILQEAVRIVKDEGVLVIVAWNESNASFGPPLERRISEHAIENLLEKYKFKVTKKFLPSPYHYGFIAERI